MRLTAQVFVFGCLPVLQSGVPLCLRLACSPKRLGLPVDAGVLAGGLSVCSSPLCLVLQWSLLWAHERLPVTLLIDSGADVVDKKFARQAGLPLVKLTEPKLLLDLDGRTLVSSTYQKQSRLLFLVITARGFNCTLFPLFPLLRFSAPLGSPVTVPRLTGLLGP